MQTLELGQSGRVLICHRQGWFSTVDSASNSTYEAFKIGETRCHLATYSDANKIALLAFREPDSRIVALRLSPNDKFTSSDQTVQPVSGSEHTPPASRIFECQFSSRIQALCLTSDQSMFVVALLNGEAICLDAKTGTEVVRWKNCAHLFRRVTLTAVGDHILSGSHEGWIRWHDIKTGKVSLEWRAHRDANTAMAIDLERSLMHSTSRDGTTQSSSFAGEPQRQFVGHDGGVSVLAFSPDCSTLASGGSNYNVFVWDTVSGEKQLKLDWHVGPVVDLFFGKDGCLYSTSLDQMIRVWGCEYPVKQ